MPAIVSLWDLTCANTTLPSHVLCLTHSLTKKVQDKTISRTNTLPFLKLTGIAVLSWSHTWQAVYSVCCQSTQSKVYWPKHFRIIKYQTDFFQGMLCEMPEKCPLVAKCECNDLFYEKHKMVLCDRSVVLDQESKSWQESVKERVCVCVGTLRMSVRMQENKAWRNQKSSHYTKDHLVHPLMSNIGWSALPKAQKTQSLLKDVKRFIMVLFFFTKK